MDTMMIDGSDFIVREVDLPYDVKAMTSPSPDGVYNIYINAKLTYEARRKAYLHELRHIWREDFASDNPVAELED